MSTPTKRRPARGADGFDQTLRQVAEALPGMLASLHQSYRDLEERAARVERELAEANRERSELAERLHAADKLSALGTLAAGIAHEIRNPLSGVRGFAELLAQRLAGEERVEQWSRRIVDGVCEVDAIIENLLSFASPEELRLEALDGQELLEGAARLAARVRAGGPPATVTTRCTAPPFAGDHIKLRQAVRNLIENALEAQAWEREPRVEVALERVCAGTSDELVFRVADAGPGVPEELRARILDPFFTTHADGTGLGLALVSVLARLHGGSVRCAHEPSHLGGALFELRIPFRPAETPAASTLTPRRLPSCPSSAS
jgi:C4-dicarboxylate-specific signal transduction histidine kinase